MVISLLIIHCLVTIAMIGLILLQKSDSSGPLGMGGGSTNSLFTARGVANVLTRVTAFLATIFIGNCILIGILTNREVDEAMHLTKIKASAPKNPAAQGGQGGQEGTPANAGQAPANPQSSTADTQENALKDEAVQGGTPNAEQSGTAVTPGDASVAPNGATVTQEAAVVQANAAEANLNESGTVATAAANAQPAGETSPQSESPSNTQNATE